MTRTVLCYILIQCTLTISAQTAISGRVIDATNKEPLPFAHITILAETYAGTNTNIDGVFSLQIEQGWDSIRISYMGYRSITLGVNQVRMQPEIGLRPAPHQLDEVVIKPIDAQEIIRNAVEAIKDNYDQDSYAYGGFYREIIGDTSGHFSVGEAVFDMVYLQGKSEPHIKLVRGRTSQDVVRSRVFEDYHPSAGPFIAANYDLTARLPTFLEQSHWDDYEYVLADIVQLDGAEMYKIAFDQRDGVKKALEKGSVMIDRNSLAIVSFESEASKKGMPYRKHLSGSDKVIAAMLNIDLRLRSAMTRVQYVPYDGKWYLRSARHIRAISYKQPRKDLDLNLTIDVDFLVSSIRTTGIMDIEKGQRWTRQQLVSRLPADSDPAFWGGTTHMTPTIEIAELIQKLAADSGTVNELPNKWRQMHAGALSVTMDQDTIVLRPLLRATWEDDNQAGCVMRTLHGDFDLSATLIVSKRSERHDPPDRGFQSGGLICLLDTTRHDLLGFGTRGNKKISAFFQETMAARSKVKSMGAVDAELQVRLVREGAQLEWYLRKRPAEAWASVRKTSLPATGDAIDIGFFAMSEFSGHGPQMYPDLTVRVENLVILGQER